MEDGGVRSLQEQDIKATPACRNFGEGGKQSQYTADCHALLPARLAMTGGCLCESGFAIEAI